MADKSRRGFTPQGGQTRANASIIVDAKDALAVAAAAPPIVDAEQIDLSDIPETDFSRPNGVRGKHYARFRAASGL